MSSLNFEQDKQTMKSKNYRLIFFIGLPGCNKESQIEKISQEYTADIMGKALTYAEHYSSRFGKSPLITSNLNSPLLSNVIKIPLSFLSYNSL